MATIENAETFTTDNGAVRGTDGVVAYESDEVTVASTIFPAAWGVTVTAEDGSGNPTTQTTTDPATSTVYQRTTTWSVNGNPSPGKWIEQ